VDFRGGRNPSGVESSAPKAEVAVCLARARKKTTTAATTSSNASAPPTPAAMAIVDEPPPVAPQCQSAQRYSDAHTHSHTHARRQHTRAPVGARVIGALVIGVGAPVGAAVAHAHSSTADGLPAPTVVMVLSWTLLPLVYHAHPRG
jgi:hypothetical protein